MESEMEVIWSSQAKLTYFMVLDYLEKNWSKKEIVRFVQRTEVILQSIKKNPEIFPQSLKQKNIRKGHVDKNNSLYYQVDNKNNKIFLLTFFDNRQNPDNLKVERI